MDKFKLLAGMVAALTCLGGAAATAEILGPSDAEIHGVQGAKLSLADAIAKAQAQNNGKAIFARYEIDKGAANYVVTIVSAVGKKDTINVDPQTGQATKAKEVNSGSSSESGKATVEQSRVSLTQAIRTAEARGGKAMRATLDTNKGKDAYKIELANGDKTQTVWIDANSNQVVDSSS